MLLSHDLLGSPQIIMPVLLAEVAPGNVLIPLYLFVAVLFMGRIVRKLTPLHERRPLINCIRMHHCWSIAGLVISLSPLLKVKEIFSRENNVLPVRLQKFSLSWRFLSRWTSFFVPPSCPRVLPLPSLLERSF